MVIIDDCQVSGKSESSNAMAGTAVMSNRNNLGKFTNIASLSICNKE